LIKLLYVAEESSIKALQNPRILLTHQIMIEKKIMKNWSSPRKVTALKNISTKRLDNPCKATAKSILLVCGQNNIKNIAEIAVRMNSK